MTQILLLVDYENVPTVDLSVLDEGHRAVIFVGHNQAPPTAATKPATAHRFARVDFQKIEGVGKNALDFHIAFYLGRVLETAPDTECIVVAKDKGYDPLLAYLNKIGFKCQRVESWAALVARQTSVEQPQILATAVAAQPPLMSLDPELTVCIRCKKASTIEHYGGRWCSNCGRFAVTPDPTQLPSATMNSPSRERHRTGDYGALAIPPTLRGAEHAGPLCNWCGYQGDMSVGIYDDGEWMCGHCVARYAT